MEDHTPNSSGRFPPKLLIGGLCLSIGCALFPAGLVLLPAFWAYAMVRTRPAIAAVFSGAFAASVFVLFSADIPLALCLVVIACASAAFLYVMQKKHMGNVVNVGAIAGVAIAALYCAICLPGILSGAGAFTAVQAEVDSLAASFRQALEAAAATTDEMRALYDTYFTALSEGVVLAVVPAICMSGMLIGLGNVLLFRLFARKGDFGLAPMRPFRLWAIPRELTIGLCVMFIGAAILNFAELDYAQSVSLTVNVLAGLPLTLQGLCCVDYLIWRKGGNVRRRRIYIYIGMGAFFYLMQMGLLLIGCVDQVFRLRDRAEGAIPPTTPRNP